MGRGNCPLLQRILSGKGREGFAFFILGGKRNCSEERGGEEEKISIPGERRRKNPLRGEEEEGRERAA